jgi:hypothetical protein
MPRPCGGQRRRDTCNQQPLSHAPPRHRNGPATTALLFEADAVSVSGTVFDPALDYSAEDCALRLSQNGNRLAGHFCERNVGLDL